MTPGQQIVAAWRQHHEVGDSLTHNTMLDDIAKLIDAALARKDEAIASATGAMRIADKERGVAIQLADERLEGLLAAAEFATILAKQLRLEQ